MLVFLNVKTKPYSLNLASKLITTFYRKPKKKTMAPRPSPQIGSERIRLVLDNGIKKARISKHSKPKGEMSLKMIHLQKLQESLNLEMVAQTKAAHAANLKVSQIFMITLLNKKSSFVSK